MGWILLYMLKYVPDVSDLNFCAIQCSNWESMFNIFQLALKDAEKVINLRNNSVNPYILKANALILVSAVCSLSFLF
jgi:hypothetical protein